jgi:pyridoxamine 5'-phosphate oxidase family protein
MSVFTDSELAYLLSQRLGRLATVRPDGRPQIAPFGFRYNAELDVIDIGGQFMSRTKKFRNVLRNPNVSLVIDDVLPPWQPRGVEIRGAAHTLHTGGKALFGAGASYVVDDAIVIAARGPLPSGMGRKHRSPFQAVCTTSIANDRLLVVYLVHGHQALCDNLAA